MVTTDTSTITTLVPNQQFNQLASDEQVARAAEALEANGMHAIVVETAEEARDAVWSMIPAKAQVYDARSQTLQEIGLLAELEERTGIERVRQRMQALDRNTQQGEIRRLSSGPEVVVGSVQAITEQGQVMLASATGSQMGAAAFGASSVIWVAGTQKIVASMEEGFRRIREYSYPLEDQRTRRVYGQASAINKVLIVNGEQPGRITVVLVKQKLGF